MAELCDLTAVELRRLIGSKQVSPVELLASCRARIEQVNPARQRLRRDLLGAGRGGGAARPSARSWRASRSGRCTACRSASRTWC